MEGRGPSVAFMLPFRGRALKIATEGLGSKQASEDGPKQWEAEERGQRKARKRNAGGASGTGVTTGIRTKFVRPVHSLKGEMHRNT